MRQISVNIYEYKELSPKAREKARQDYARGEGYLHAEEAKESITKLAEHFGGKVTDYDIDWSGAYSHSTMEFDMPHKDDMDAEEIETRLLALGNFNPETLMGVGECKLTGVCYDEDAIDGFRKAWHKGERDIYRLMEAAFRSLLAQCQSEYDCFYAHGDNDDSEFNDHCEANNYEFYEDGTAY